MKVFHIVPAVSEEASGPSYSVVRLCESLIDEGTDARVIALDWNIRSRQQPYLRTFAVGPGPRRLGMSASMRDWLAREADERRVDVMHSHSLWMMPNVYPGRVCRTQSQCKLVVSPRGTLSRWSLARNSWQKRLFWRFVQGPALRPTACFHATAESEYHDIRRLGFAQPVCVIPNGVDVPPLDIPTRTERRQLLFLGRLHPVKGLDVLLRAWARVERRFTDWDLLIAGPDNDGYLGELERLSCKLRLARVRFCGAVYGADKLRAYRAASLFVLPTYSENFGIAVAEALAAGTPSIVSVGAPWEQLDAVGAGWWIQLGVEPLVACLEQALAIQPSRLKEMGLAGRAWMKRDFSWAHTAEQFSETYRWLLYGGNAPACLRVH